MGEDPMRWRMMDCMPPFWQRREYQRYLEYAQQRHRQEVEEIKKRKILSEEEMREKLTELNETLDTFKGQKVPTRIIPVMRALHQELKDAGYNRLEQKKKGLKIWISENLYQRIKRLRI